MESVNLPPTEPESEAALSIKPGDWIEVCIPTGANPYEYPHFQGAVIQVQSVEPRLQEITAANITWSVLNVRKTEHPTELRAKIEAMEKDRLRLVRAKGLDLEARVEALECVRDLHGTTLKTVNDTLRSLGSRIDILSERVSNSNKIGAA